MLRAIARIAACLLLTYAGIAAAQPSQFISRVYTEGLGRAATATEFNAGVSYFATNGCNVNTLRQFIWDRLNTSASNLPTIYGLHNEGRQGLALIAYRVAFNREPESASALVAWANFIKVNTPPTPTYTWNDLLWAFLYSYPEITSMNYTTFCGARYSPSSAHAAVQGFNAVSESALAYDVGPSSGLTTVTLSEGTLVVVNSTITIAPGKTLRTQNLPSKAAYARMARIVRGSNFNGPLLSLGAGAKIENVWIDGQRHVLPTVSYEPNEGRANLLLLGGVGTSVTNSVLSDSAGRTTLYTQGRIHNTPCKGNIVKDNRITGYTGSYNALPGIHGSPWTDALSIQCEDVLVEGNEIVDATDAAIAVFFTLPSGGECPERASLGDLLASCPQSSIVRNNKIMSLGNSAYWGLVYEPGGAPDARTRSFAGSSFSDNTFYTSPNALIEVVIGVGTRILWGNSVVTGKHGTFVGNGTAAGGSIRGGAAVVIGGMIDSTVLRNDFPNFTKVSVFNPTTCPQLSSTSAIVWAENSSTHASGNLQTATSIALSGCLYSK
jgi:hypothetical protein